MKNIATRNNATIDLQQYIKKELFDETGRQEIWLHNLPNTSFLFDIINKLRNKYKDETFVIIQNINITNENIDKEVLFLDCFFENEISFENCIFSKNAYFTNSIFNNSVCFTNSTFKNDVCFKKCTFIDNPFFNYSFENVIFEGENIDFSNSDFYNVNFSKTIFGKSKKTHISFEGAKLSNTFFEKAKFKRKILFNKSKIENGRITEIQNTKFNEAIFFDQANFQDVIFLGSISFEKTQFKGDTFFLETNFYNDNQNLEKEVIQVNFEYALFSKKVYFTKSKFGIKKNGSKEDNYDIEILFKNTIFRKGVDFYKTIFYCPIYFSNAEFCVNENTYSKYIINFEKAQFKKKVNFHYSEFYNTVRFENTKFENLVDFYNAHFYRAQQFHFTDFLDRAIFSNTEFDEEVQFLHCRVDSNSYIRFESVTFKKSLDISRSNFNDKANFWNIEIEEGDILTSSKYQDDFEVHKNEINSEKTVPSIYKQLRETYRIIKSNFYSQNNKIEGLKFYEKEMSVYLEEKRAEDKKSDSTNKFILRNLNLENKIHSFFANKSATIKENKIHSFFTNKSAIIKKKLTSFCSFFLCFYQNILLPSYELFPFIEIFKSILSQSKETFKEVFSFLYKLFYIILYIIVIFLKEFRNRNITLYRSSFCIMILFFFLAYMIKKEYCWFWAFVIISTFVVLTEFYDRRKDTRKLIRSNNYIPFVLITFALIWSFIVFYSYGNYKQDFFYLLINKIYYYDKIIIKDIDMLFIGSYGIIILSFIFVVVFRRQDKIILWFNKNSNEFDTNWVVGVNFSLLVGTLTYLIVLSSMFIFTDLTIDNINSSIFLTSLVDVFNITKWDNLEIIGVKLKGFSYLLLFIGRIFIGYGYYQTIQAFRKFGKS